MENPSQKNWFFMNCILLGSLSALLSVAFGAFGAHYLKPRLSADSMATLHTAIQYQMFHSLALIIVGNLVEARDYGLKLLRGAAISFISGILIFSGSLILLVITHVKLFALVTPIGGLLFLSGWALLALSSVEGK